METKREKFEEAQFYLNYVHEDIYDINNEIIIKFRLGVVETVDFYHTDKEYYHYGVFLQYNTSSKEINYVLRREDYICSEIHASREGGIDKDWELIEKYDDEFRTLFNLIGKELDSVNEIFIVDSNLEYLIPQKNRYLQLIEDLKKSEKFEKIIVEELKILKKSSI